MAAGGRSRRSATRSVPRRPRSWLTPGHTNPSLALAVYAQAMRMSEKEKARLRALVEGTLGSLGSRWDQDDGRESPQIATIESAEANGRKAAGSRRKVGQP